LGELNKLRQGKAKEADSKLSRYKLKHLSRDPRGKGQPARLKSTRVLKEKKDMIKQNKITDGRIEGSREEGKNLSGQQSGSEVGNKYYMEIGRKLQSGKKPWLVIGQKYSWSTG